MADRRLESIIERYRVHRLAVHAQSSGQRKEDGKIRLLLAGRFDCAVSRSQAGPYRLRRGTHLHSLDGRVPLVLDGALKSRELALESALVRLQGVDADLGLLQLCLPRGALLLRGPVLLRTRSRPLLGMDSAPVPIRPAVYRRIGIRTV